MISNQTPSGIVETTPPSGLPDGQRRELSLTDAGELRVTGDFTVTGAAGGTSSTFDAAFPASGTAVGASDGSNMKPILVDGSGNLKVNVVAGSTSGTQYADGAARSSATGTLAMGDDGTNIQSLACDTAGKLKILLDQYTPVAGKLPVDGSSVTQPVSGTVTANLAANVVEDAASAGAETAILVAGVRNDAATSKTSADGDFGNFAIDAAGRIGIADLGGSITVDGTVAATQSGTWNVGTVSTITNVVHVDDNSATLSIDDGGGSITVDGTVTTSGTATVTGNKVEDAAASDGDAGLPILGVRNDSAVGRTSADGDYGMVALDAAGRVGIADLGGAISVDDNGGSLTIDGTVAATQSGTWNVGTLSTISDVVHVDDNASSLSVDDGGGSLTVDNAGTFAVQATIAAGATSIAKAEDVASADGDVGVPSLAVRKATPANTSGADGDYEFLQMSAGRLWTSATIDAALPAGSNAIGKLAANDGVDIGDVTINNASGASAVNIQDGGNSITVDGTVAATQNGTWNVTNVSGTVSLPTGASTSAKQDTQITAEQAIQTSVELIDDAIKADDAAFTPATTKVMMAGFEFDDSSPDSVDEGDAGAARMSANRNIYTQLRDAAGNERGANVNASNQLSVSVDNTVTVASHAVTNAGTFAVQAAQSGTWTVQPGNTANTTAWKVDASSVAVPVTDNSGSLTVDNAGTFAVQATVAAGATNIAKAEDVASADADVGVPAMAIRKATPANTSGTDGDYEMLQMSAGRLWTSSTIDAALPAGTNAIGKLAANSGVTIGAVEIAASQSITAVDPKSSTASDTAPISVGTSSVSLIASNASRKAAYICNASTSGQILSLGFGASPTNYNIQVYPGGTWIETIFTGEIRAKASAASGSAQVVEM